MTTYKIFYNYNEPYKPLVEKIEVDSDNLIEEVSRTYPHYLVFNDIECYKNGQHKSDYIFTACKVIFWNQEEQNVTLREFQLAYGIVRKELGVDYDPRLVGQD